MTVVVNESAIGALLNSTIGPVGIFIADKASRVAEIAQANASGPILNIESGALVAGIKPQMHGGPNGVSATVSTDAKRVSKSYPNGFAYPQFHDVSYPPGVGGGAGTERGGQHQWLTQALREVFPG